MGGTKLIKGDKFSKISAHLLKKTNKNQSQNTCKL
jgi:hypothetical protein